MVIFDFDGTLADTGAAVVETVKGTLEHLGIGRFSRETVLSLMGLPLAETYRKAGVPRQLLDAALRTHRRLFPDRAHRVVLMPAAEVVLQRLADAGIPVGIASSRGRHSLHILLDQLGISGRFFQALGDEDVSRKKPAPDPVFKLAQLRRVDPRQICVVGDTTYDIEMGRSAGALTCAVPNGGHTRSRLQAAEPTWLIDSLVQLLQLVRAPEARG